jgi:hypothetical protein
MLRKSIIAGIIMTAAAVCAFAQRPGSTMTTTLEDGSEITLQPDSTWSFVRPKMDDLRDDEFITLKDNRILWIKTDYTWTFTKTQPRANKPREFASIMVVGVATKPDLSHATNAATEDAYNKIATQLRRYIPPKANPKTAQAYLLACIKNEIKENDIELNYAPGWKAEAKVNVLGHRVRNIVDCLEVQLDPGLQ